MMLTKETFHGILVFVAKLNFIELPGCEPDARVRFVA
jgi:hypothetical protein